MKRGETGKTGTKQMKETKGKREDRAEEVLHLYRMPERIQEQKTAGQPHHKGARLHL